MGMTPELRAPILSCSLALVEATKAEAEAADRLREATAARELAEAELDAAVDRVPRRPGRKPAEPMPVDPEPKSLRDIRAIAIDDRIAMERGEFGLTPAWRSRGLLGGAFDRLLPNDTGTVRVDVRFGADFTPEERWLWTLTGSACTVHIHARGEASSAAECMLDAERWVVDTYVDAPRDDAQDGAVERIGGGG